MALIGGRIGYCPCEYACSKIEAPDNRSLGFIKYNLVSNFDSAFIEKKKFTTKLSDV